MEGFDRTYAEVDLGAIRHNIKEVRKNIKAGTKIMAVVKADAYGHGAIPVVDALADLVDAYGVAVAEEALELREHGIDKTILILGYTPESSYEQVVRNHISQTVYTFEMAEKLNETAASLGERAPVHIKLDTGMGRIGFFPTEENVRVALDISRMPNLILEGIFTHFARADETDILPAEEPFRAYLDFVGKLEEAGVKVPLKHVSNSAAIIGFPDANLDMVRCGIATYGLYPSGAVDKRILSLRPAMQWKTVVSYVKEIPAGMSISYGGTFTADRKMRVATIPVGYADGMKRDLSNKGRVLVRGKPARILGRICMDQFMVDVTEIPGVREGDEVTIFGRDGEAFLPVEEIAESAHSFHYEFVCGITKRVLRKYRMWE